MHRHKFQAPWLTVRIRARQTRLRSSHSSLGFPKPQHRSLRPLCGATTRHHPPAPPPEFSSRPRRNQSGVLVFIPNVLSFLPPARCRSLLGMHGLLILLAHACFNFLGLVAAREKTKNTNSPVVSLNGPAPDFLFRARFEHPPKTFPYPTTKLPFDCPVVLLV